MSNNFNTYIESPSVVYWRKLCLSEGTLRHYDKGETFFTTGQVARYFGYIHSETLKYVAYSDDGTEHVIGPVFAGEFVTDFPFSLYGQKARASVVAETLCDVYCLSTATLGEQLTTDSELRDMVMSGMQAVFSTLYDRYIDLHVKSAQQRYNDLNTSINISY